MRLEDLMACDPPPLRPGDSIRDAAQRMVAGRCGALPVCEAGQLVGLVTDHDISRAVAGDRDPGGVPVEELMDRDVPAAAPEATLLEASEVMAERRRGHLCVSKQGRYLGMVYLELRWNELGDGMPVPTASFGGPAQP